MTEEEAYRAAVGKGAFAGMNPPKPGTTDQSSNLLQLKRRDVTISFARKALLERLCEKPSELSAKYPPLKWALEEGYAEQVGDKYQITKAGRACYAEAAMEPSLRRAVEKMLPRVGHRTLCRQASSTDEAVAEGGGYLYFLEPGHRPFPPVSGRLLIEHGYLRGQNDGLFDGMSQTFVVTGDA